MGSCVTGDILRVTAKLAYNSGVDDIQNVYHLQYVGATETDAVVHAAIATVLNTAYGEIIVRIPSTTTFESIETWNVTQDRPMVEDDWPTLTVGQTASDPLPAQCSCLVLFDTNAPRSQGRKYLPFFTEGLSTAGILSGATLNDVADYIAVLLSEVDGGTWAAIFGNWSPTLERFAAWISGAAQAIVRTQRRRVRGVGS